MSTTSYPVLQELRVSSGAFGAIAASRPDTMLVGRSPDVTRVSGLGATGDYFTTLGASPALGRFLGHPTTRRRPATRSSFSAMRIGGARTAAIARCLANES